MSKVSHDFERIEKVLNRLEARLGLSVFALGVISTPPIEEFLEELAIQVSVCNTGVSSSALFHCSSVFSSTCKPPSGATTFQCATQQYNSGACGSGVPQHKCSTGAYCTGAPPFACSQTQAQPGQGTVYECGSFECTNPNPSNFDCKNGFNCNAATFGCSDNQFKCTGSNNFVCTSVHECKNSHECGNAATGKNFQCQGTGSGDKYDCRGSFTCASNATVKCVQGQYTCNVGGVNCNPNPYSPPKSTGGG